MLVKIKIKDVLAFTGKSTLYLLKHEREVWLPNKLTRNCQGNYISIPEWLAKEKELEYSMLYHIPEKIEPEYNQEALDELKY